MKADLDERVELLRNGLLAKGSLDIDNDNLLQFFDLYYDFHEKRAELEDVDIIIDKSCFNDKRRIVDVNKILKYDGEKFVKTAYLALFGRIPGYSERETLLHSLNSGKESKLDALIRLGATEEARYKNVALEGIDSIDAGTILKYEDREFVRVAYLLIFGRQSDLDGEEQFLRSLRTGNITKPGTIVALRDSEEAKKVGLNITGVEEALNAVPRDGRLYTLPVIGKCMKFLRNLKRSNAQILSLKGEDNVVRDDVNFRLANTDDSVREIKSKSDIMSDSLKNTESEVFMLRKEVEELKAQIELLKKESR